MEIWFHPALIRVHGGQKKFHLIDEVFSYSLILITFNWHVDFAQVANGQVKISVGLRFPGFAEEIYYIKLS